MGKHQFSTITLVKTVNENLSIHRIMESLFRAPVFRAWLPNCAWGIFLEDFKLEVVLAIFGAIAV